MSRESDFVDTEVIAIRREIMKYTLTEEEKKLKIQRHKARNKRKAKDRKRKTREGLGIYYLQV